MVCLRWVCACFLFLHYYTLLLIIDRGSSLSLSIYSWMTQNSQCQCVTGRFLAVLWWFLLLCLCVCAFDVLPLFFFFGRHSLNVIFDVCLCVHILCPLTTGDHCCVHWRYYLYCSKLATIISEHIILYRGPFAARAFVLCEETNIGIDSEKRKQICNVCW